MEDMKAKAAELRAKAAKRYQDAADSFARCDTDGFVSQAASTLSAQKLELEAQILMNGGMAEFTGLYEGDRRVAARLVTSRFGTSWCLSDEESDKFGRKFIPFGSRSRIQKQLGLQERLERAPAKAEIVGSGKGLSGLASARVAAVRAGKTLDAKNGLNAVLVEDK